MRKKRYGMGKYILTITFMTILIVGFIGSASQAAEKYPSRPIRIYVPWSLGGSTDYMARALQPYLKEVLGAPAVIVVNKPGGRSLVGVGAFARERADGYTIMIDDAASMGVAYLWTDKPPFDWNDFTALTQLLLDPRYMFVRKDSPYKDMNDFVEDARKNPGRLSVSVPAGSGAHWLMAYINKVMDLPVSIVGYGGGGPASAAMLGGHVTGFFSEGLARAPLRDKLKAIGVSIPERGTVFPEAVPMVEQRVFKEKGVTSLPGYEAAFNTAVLVHTELKKKHPDRYKKLLEAVFKVKEHPEFQKRAKDLNIDKVAVWYSPERSEEVRANAVKNYQENKWIIDEMKKK